MKVLIRDLWTGEYDVVSIQSWEYLSNSDNAARYECISVDP